MRRIDEIEQRLSKATPGPWLEQRYDESQTGILPPPEHVARNALITTVSVGFMRPDGHANAAFIAAAPVDIHWLLARIRSLEAGLAEYGQHGPGCWYLPRAAIEGGDTEPCICGLMALLAGERK